MTQPRVAHYIEEIATVYLRLSADGKRWEIDGATLDGDRLAGYDGGPVHSNCGCDEQSEEAGNELARKTPLPPNASELLHALAKAMGYALVSPEEVARLRAWGEQASSEVERLDEQAEVTCDYRRRDERVWGYQDASGAEKDSHEAWRFGYAYALHAALYASEVRWSRKPIQDAWQEWRATGIVAS